MCNIGMRALVPVKRSGVDDTLAIRNDWGLIHMPCPVETAMGRLSRSYGECIRTQRRLFGKRRGTAVRFGDDADSLFVQLKLSEQAPGLGYVHLGSFHDIFVDLDGKCTIRFDTEHSLHTYWNIQTVEKHIAKLTPFIEEPVSLLITHPKRMEMERLAELRKRMMALRVIFHPDQVKKGDGVKCKSIWLHLLFVDTKRLRY